MKLAPDRRREERRSAHGAVTIIFEDPLPQDVTGRLIDISESGFRSAHDYPRLHTGQEVRFEHSAAKGLARVVWNRIASNRIETGFVVLSSETIETR